VWGGGGGGGGEGGGGGGGGGVEVRKALFQENIHHPWPRGSAALRELEREEDKGRFAAGCIKAKKAAKRASNIRHAEKHRHLTVTSFFSSQ